MRIRIRGDQQNCYAPTGDGLLTNVQDVRTRIAALFEEYRNGAGRCPFVNNVGRAIAE
jgi:hypothetical protein